MKYQKHYPVTTRNLHLI